MRVLSKQQCHTMPIDEIKTINKWWETQLKQTPQWNQAQLKYKNIDVKKFIHYNAPELLYQFEWTQLSGAERMMLKFQTYSSSDDFCNGEEINDSQYEKYYYPE